MPVLQGRFKALLGLAGAATIGRLFFFGITLLAVRDFVRNGAEPAATTLTAVLLVSAALTPLGPASLAPDVARSLAEHPTQKRVSWAYVGLGRTWLGFATVLCAAASSVYAIGWGPEGGWVLFAASAWLLSLARSLETCLSVVARFNSNPFLTFIYGGGLRGIVLAAVLVAMSGTSSSSPVFAFALASMLGILIGTSAAFGRGGAPPVKTSVQIWNDRATGRAIGGASLLLLPVAVRIADADASLAFNLLLSLVGAANLIQTSANLAIEPEVTVLLRADDPFSPRAKSTVRLVRRVALFVALGVAISGAVGLFVMDTFVLNLTTTEFAAAAAMVFAQALTATFGPVGLAQRLVTKGHELRAVSIRAMIVEAFVFAGCLISGVPAIVAGAVAYVGYLLTVNALAATVVHRALGRRLGYA